MIEIKMTKELNHYLDKLESEIKENLDEKKGALVRGCIDICRSKYIDKEDFTVAFNWTMGQLSLIHILELIKESTYQGLKENLWRIRDNIDNMPF